MVVVVWLIWLCGTLIYLNFNIESFECLTDILGFIKNWLQTKTNARMNMQ